MDEKKYEKIFRSINNRKLKKEYANMRKFIKENYINYKEYDDICNIELEIERLNNYIKMLNNPFISIIVAIGLMGVGQVLSTTNESSLFNGLYLIFSLVTLGVLVMKINQKFMFAIISVEVLKEIIKLKIE